MTNHHDLFSAETGAQSDCGHVCCSTPGDPHHGHFLSPADCQLCEAGRPQAVHDSVDEPTPWPAEPCPHPESFLEPLDDGRAECRLCRSTVTIGLTG